nr:hypothetical protein [Tanacetum cinerariifolium]
GRKLDAVVVVEGRVGLCGLAGIIGYWLVSRRLAGSGRGHGGHLAEAQVTAAGVEVGGAQALAQRAGIDHGRAERV